MLLSIAAQIDLEGLKGMAASPAASMMDQQLHLVSLWQPQLPPEIGGRGRAWLGLVSSALAKTELSTVYSVLSTSAPRCLVLSIVFMF